MDFTHSLSYNNNISFAFCSIFFPYISFVNKEGIIKFVQCLIFHQLTPSSKQEKLADIDDSIVQAEQFLQEISNDPDGKLACLNMFVESRKLVDWLQSISTGQNSVYIALDFVVINTVLIHY